MFLKTNDTGARLGIYIKNIMHQQISFLFLKIATQIIGILINWTENLLFCSKNFAEAKPFLKETNPKVY